MVHWHQLTLIPTTKSLGQPAGRRHAKRRLERQRRELRARAFACPSLTILASTSAGPSAPQFPACSVSNERCLTHEIQSVICIDSRANERLSSLNFEDTHCASIAPVRLLAEAQNVRSTSDQKNESGVFTSRLPKKSKNAVVVSDASFGLKQTTYASHDTPFRSVIVVIKPSIDMRAMQRAMQRRSMQRIVV